MECKCCERSFPQETRQSGLRMTQEKETKKPNPVSQKILQFANTKLVLTRDKESLALLHRVIGSHFSSAFPRLLHFLLFKNYYLA